MELDGIVEALEPNIHDFFVSGGEKEPLLADYLHVVILLLHLPGLLGGGEDADALYAAQRGDLFRLLRIRELVLIADHGAVVGVHHHVPLTESEEYGLCFKEGAFEEGQA